MLRSESTKPTSTRKSTDTSTATRGLEVSDLVHRVQHPRGDGIPHPSDDWFLLATHSLA
ncbi:hypothetical protein SynPROSU1_01067 [Synechococcus sp. PROS-U-1]|nr:hypothetical protein SynPROSU1_01067 [Synechococcus sp. PROS-U-1]